MTELLFEEDSFSESQTEQMGKKLATLLHSGDFVAMYGDLGAGKTAFVRGMASFLTPDTPVSSPTYTIVNEYRSSSSSAVFRHLDLYRIQSEEDLYSIGYYDYLGEGFLAAEWCENVPYALPESYLCVRITKIGETARRITVSRVTDPDSSSF